MKRKNPPLLLLVIIFLIAVTLVNAYMFMQIQSPKTPAPETPGLETDSQEPIPRYIPVSPPGLEGYVPIEVDVTANIIYLTHNCSQMTMITTASQTYSIENGIRGVIDPRPTPHDVMKEVLENWGINVTMARIEKMVEDTYYATLVFEEDNRTLLLDTRPSDSIATAVRFGAPIYINQELLEEQATNIC